MNRNDRAIVGLVMVAHASVHTYELSVPILVGVWLEEFSVSTATMGAVVTAGYALFGLGALPGGIIADAVGSRRLIAACLLGMGGSFLVLGVAPGVATIAGALVLWGVAASAYHPSGLALISTGVDERGAGFAYHGMAGNLGIALGPLATTLLLVPFGWRTVVTLLALPAGAAALFALRIDVDETAAVEQPTAEADGGGAESKAPGVRSLSEFVAGSRRLFSGAFVLVFGIVVASGLFYRGVLTFLPEILDGFSQFRPITVGGRELRPSRYAYAGLLTVGMAGQYVGGRLTDRIRPARGIAVSFGALGFLALGFVPALESGLVGFLVVGVLLGFVLFLVQPMYQATVAELTPPGTRGLSYGYTYLGVFGVGALGGVLAGGILQYRGPPTLFAGLAGVAAVAAGIAAVLSRYG